ncbi:MAG: hypothetical protein LKG14_05520 [Prevotella sp.]|jgi:hypothetical protein|nr:hypothetical protein [Prevotella sp.]
MEIDINKNRSFTACLRDARNFVTENIKPLIQKTWIPAVVLSVLGAFCIFFRLPNLSLHNWGIAHPWASWIFQTIIYAGTLIAEIFYFSNVFNAVNGYGRKKNLWRYVQYFLITVCADVVLCLVAVGLKKLLTLVIGGRTLSHIANMSIFGIYALICLVLFCLVLIPLLYIAPKYMMDPEAKWKQFFKHFSTGLHRWGMLFLTSLLLIILIGILTFIVALPAIVLILAQISSQMGLFMGDPSNLPGYFPVLSFIVFALTTLLFSGLMIYAIVTYIYVYGSIDTQEENKKELMPKQNEKKQDTLY